MSGILMISAKTKLTGNLIYSISTLAPTLANLS